jgi:acyl carrier protein|tara:strand:+ start:213 stop:455 length:243 start_codon:yes stop_codon:yes gene_type:complete
MKKTNIDKKVIQLISKCFKINKSKVNTKTSSKDVKKWDSIGQIKLILQIEQSFKIRIPQNKFTKLISVRLISDYLLKKIK